MIVHKKQSNHRKALVVCFALFLAGLILLPKLLNQNQKASVLQQPDNQQPNNQTTQNPTKDEPKQELFNKKLHSTTDTESIWFIANKHSSLPLTYVPADLYVPPVPLRLDASQEQMQLRRVLHQDIVDLFQDAVTAGLSLRLGSGYRSAALQKSFYDGYVQTQGRQEADRSSARPGHSEHQTGLALDFTKANGACHLEACFGETPEGKWLFEHATEYGFILRYPQSKEAVTGYMYEPWHFRYVGRELARELKAKDATTLEEYFETGAAPDYIK